jgi:hypothetical protein
VQPIIETFVLGKFMGKIFFSLGILILHIKVQAVSSSDQYCGYLQQLHAQSLQNPSIGNPIRNFITELLSFGNSLTSKTTLADIETEAIQKSMTFEVFQAWVKEQKKIEVPARYKPDYLKHYMENICGEITNSATYGSMPEALFEATAAKQFDPSGHAYFKDFNKPSPEMGK